ncbi:general secretion pathway protein E [Inhella inkyongensis]|uniref:General secretion pathway protein E n=1 Tax=Inhella inkyongensis TaxID=392593 RepID=A0A840S4J6_9BURK|nr:GspE/PulE family protein [Inhella inkyongensis]MBB5204482.1 general secretion pathway protein E [Inhella inkyongensis]
MEKLITPPLQVLGESSLLLALLEQGLIDERTKQAAVTLSENSHLPVATALLRLNALAELPLYSAMGALLDWPLMRSEETEGLDGFSLQKAASDLGLNPHWLRAKGVWIFRGSQGYLVAFRDAPASEVCELFNRLISRPSPPLLNWRLILPSAYERLSNFADEEANAQVGPIDDLQALRELAEEGPTIELVNGTLSKAVTQRASDLHFEPEEGDFVVRARIDGDMQELARYGRDRFDAVACRVKILANLDIAERRLPQDGRIGARVNGENFDIRVSILPGAHGESMVLRLLRQERKPTQLQDLGMNAEQADMFEAWGRLSNGIVLVTGPTGSGKSTTLYTALELANDRSKKIITVEDPIEYKIRGITQLQVNTDIGFTFAAALRSILRHDPDTILLGEIRDKETAGIAIQSALTGHLVLSTLHTNSAIGAITRLVDMGIEPFLIAASVRGLIAQRLVRRLCDHCAEPDSSPDEALQALLRRFDFLEHARPRKATGCAHCAGIGFFGRLAIYDMLEVNEQMGHRIAAGDGEAALLAATGRSRDDGLLRSGVRQVAEGRTTLAEVLRASSSN